MKNKEKEYIAVIVDEDGQDWVYEGSFGGNDMFTKSQEAKPKFLTETEAYMVAAENTCEGNTGAVRKK